MIFLLLFALPFAGGGTFVGYLAASTVTTWVRAQSWEEVPARIISTDLDVNQGDDGSTYSVQAQYEYLYRGEAYSSDRVHGGFGSDNIGSFHQDKYNELRAYQANDRMFRAFVNPEDPSESLLYRDMRWGMLGFELVFALAFGLVGYGLMFLAVYGNRVLKESETLKEKQPEEPWLWEKDWVDGRITAGSRGKLIGSFLFATLWNLISAPMVFIVPREVADGNTVALVGLLFPLIGAGLIVFTVYAFLQWRKFGNTEFEMFTRPGVRGGYLEGRINTNIRSRPTEDFKLTLDCIRKETTGSGKNRSTREVNVWQDVASVPANTLLSGPHGASVPVRFAIPLSAGSDSAPDASTPVIWRLSVAAELPGVDYSTTFDVPVFETADSDPELKVDTGKPPIAEDHSTTADLVAMGIVRTSTPDGGLAYLFRRARATTAAMSLTFFTLLWCGIIWVLMAVDAPVIFPIVFGLFAILLFWGLVDMWLKQTRIEIAGGRLAFNRRYLGSGKTVIIEAADISGIRTKRGMQSGRKVYYQLELRTRTDKKHILASQITDQRLAQRIVEDIEDALTAPT